MVPGPAAPPAFRRSVGERSPRCSDSRRQVGGRRIPAVARGPPLTSDIDLAFQAGHLAARRALCVAAGSLRGPPKAPRAWPSCGRLCRPSRRGTSSSGTPAIEELRLLIVSVTTGAGARLFADGGPSDARLRTVAAEMDPWDPRHVCAVERAGAGDGGRSGRRGPRRCLAPSTRRRGGPWRQCRAQRLACRRRAAPRVRRTGVRRIARRSGGRPRSWSAGR